MLVSQKDARFSENGYDTKEMKFFERLRRAPRQNPSAAEIRAFFNRAAQDEEHYPSTIDPRIFHVKLVLQLVGEHVARRLAEIRPPRVADVGSGKGRFARIVKEQYPAASVIAVDLAEAMLGHVPPGIE